MYHPSRSLLSASLVLALAAFAPACGDDGEGANPDDAHLMFVTAPPAAITVDTPVAVTYMVHTEGDLHHTEIRACMGHSTDCGLGDASSFDINFPGTKEGDTYNASVMLGTEGPWTIAVFAHVGETPHISDVIHATVAP